MSRRLLSQQRQALDRLNLTLVVVLLGLTGLILFMVPNGYTEPDSPISHRFAGDAKFRRYVLSNIVPEIEQVNVGFLLAPYLDPFITVEQAQNASHFTLELYKAMERDPHFHQLGSVMGWAYAELGGQRFDVGHYYLYIPSRQTDVPLPAILFLHGSGGNFKAYSWAWAKFAEEQEFVIIAPSFGFGNWSRPGGVTTALRALEDAESVVAIDPDRIYLAGLSNGGLGVSALSVAAPERFQGLIFLSPVINPQIVRSAAFRQAWAHRPVLVITGEKDRRIPVDYVDRQAATLQESRVDVTYISYADEDHFLFFSQLDRALNDISSWLSAPKHYSDRLHGNRQIDCRTIGCD